MHLVTGITAFGGWRVNGVLIAPFSVIISFNCYTHTYAISDSNREVRFATNAYRVLALALELFAWETPFVQSGAQTQSENRRQAALSR